MRLSILEILTKYLTYITYIKLLTGIKKQLLEYSTKKDLEIKTKMYTKYSETELKALLRQLLVVAQKNLTGFRKIVAASEEAIQ